MTLRAVLIRIATTFITLFGVAVIVFVTIRLAPGDPIAMMLPPGATQADMDHLRALYGLDKSIPSNSSSGSARCCKAISVLRSHCAKMS